MLETLSPVQSMLVGAVLAAAVLLPFVMLYRSRATEAADRAERAEVRTERTRGILSASPDGIFLWDHATGGITCSSRLAEMLGLEAGTLARYDDIRACFDERGLQDLEQGVSLLRAKGTPFQVLLRRNGRTYQASGSRAENRAGDAVADIVWLSDVSEAAVAVDRPRNASGLEDRHLTALLDTMPIPVWLRDADLNVAFLNRAAERVRGLDPALAERARSEARSMRARADLTEHGQTKPMDLTETPLGQGADAAKGGTIGFAVDISDIGAAETPPASPTDLLRALEVGVAVFDSDTTLVAANRAFADLWRLDAEWLETRPTMGDLLIRLRELRRLPEVANFAEFRDQELARFNGMERLFEEEMHLPDDRTVRRRIGPLDNGGLVMTCEDVSAKLDLQRSLKSLDRVQRTTLENLREGVAVFGGDGRLKLFNRRLPELWDLGEEDLAADKRLADVVEVLGMRLAANDEPWPERRERIAAEVLGRTPTTGKVELVNGRILAFANIPLPDGASLVSYGDITDSHRVEEALRERARTLAEADRMKTEFIANVSMEVRTPLNTITGFADILRQEMFGELNRRQKEYADGILETAGSMMGVVANIFDLATIEAGRMELEKDTIDPHAVLVSAFNLIKEPARRKNIRVDFDCPPDIGWITADARRLTQVVFNLLTNAVNFTPKLGQVMLSAARDKDWIDIVISDSGPGIPQAYRADVFAPFAHAPGGDHKSQGPGLGLSIVKRFVQLHGGQVAIRSNKARGTTVICRLPIDGENTRGLAPFDTDHAIVTERAAE